MTDQATARAQAEIERRKEDGTWGGPAAPTTFRPLYDRVLVRPERVEEMVTASGIVIPEDAQEAPQMAEVIAVGPGPREVAASAAGTGMAVKVGDVVVHGRYSGSEIELDGETMLILREADIMGVVEGGE